MAKTKKGTLLVIDDSELNLAAIKEILSADYTVYTENNGYDGIKAALRYMPDIIILDIIMPKIDGFETIVKLKEKEETRNIPVIFITGLTDSKDEEKGLSLGGADYITKPFSPEIVKLRVRNQMRLLDYIHTIEDIGKRDPLTNMPNRRSFDERIYLEWKRAMREKSIISLLIVDIDNFRVFNDTYGHLRGDLVLTTIANLITQTLKRPGDFAARWGGEEFIVLLPETEVNGAFMIAEQIRDTISNNKITLPDGQIVNVSVSIGINTRVPTPDYSVDNLIHYADDALYIAKVNGRNRVQCYDAAWFSSPVQRSAEMKTIFAVDDNSTNLLAAEEALSEQYNVVTLSSASIMFDFLNTVVPDLILLDIEMPDMNGFEALKVLKDDMRHASIPVIFLTAKTDDASEARGFEMGVVDFIQKPFSKPVLRNRIKAHLDIDEIIRDRTNLLQQRTELLQYKTEKLIRLQNSMTTVLANIVENRDKLAGSHVEHTAKYLRILLNALFECGSYVDEVMEWDVEGIISSARLHDIGKVAVSDVILNKPGKLTSKEYEIVKKHAGAGEDIITDVIAESGSDPFLHNAKVFAGSHHEKWDGTGYPRGLKGEEIPLQGRIMAIADVYDALVSERPYKHAFSHAKAEEIIRENSGTHFDPQIVDIFLKVSSLFAEVV